MNFIYILAELKVVIVALLLGGLVGYFTGYFFVSIAVVLLFVLLWALNQLAKLRKWVELGALTEDTPHLYGAADEVIEQVCEIKKENTRQQEKLAELLYRFEAATGAMPDSMLIVNAQKNIEWANLAAQKTLGIDLEKDIGQRINNIVRDPIISNYLTAGNFEQPLEFSSVNSQDNDLMLRVFPYGDGKSLLIVHDHRDLLRLQQVRKAFISNASHEMRTPLTVIIGYLEALTLRDDTNTAVSKGIEGALEQAHRLKQLIEDLLSLSRLESLPLSKSEIGIIDVAELINESVDLVKASSIYRGHNFTLNIHSFSHIKGDRRELHSAIQNVIDNAVKYSPDNTLIKIEWRQDTNENGLLSIQDSGEGVEESQILRLTERFYRVDKGRSRDMGGTGLGLSIVKHVMERHGGEILINSNIGVGTRVELHFPKDRLHQETKRIAG